MANLDVGMVVGLIKALGSLDSGGGGGSTGGGVMVVHATSHYNEEYDETYYTADKSFDEVASFIENGGIPILIDDDNGYVAQWTEVRQNSLGDIICFRYINISNDSIFSEKYEYYVDPSFTIPNFIAYEEVSYGGSDGGDDPES